MPNIRLRGLVAGVLATVTFVAVGASAERAQAAIGELHASLAIVPVSGNPGRCTVKVRGYVSMSQGEAQGLIAGGHRIVVRVWGEDPIVADELLIGPRVASAVATARGLDFNFGMTVPTGQLNEDDPTLPTGGGDEVYAGVRLLNSSGETVRSATTDRIGSEFGNGCDGPQTLF